MSGSLPQQKHLFTGRWRKVRAPQPTEMQIHSAIVKRLRIPGQCRAGTIWFHPANGELREDRFGAKLKAMGVRPGVSDLLFLWSTSELKALFLEIKSQRGRQSPAQKQFESDCGQIINCFYELANSVDAAVAILRRYGLLVPEGGRHGVIASS